MGNIPFTLLLGQCTTRYTCLCLSYRFAAVLSAVTHSSTQLCLQLRQSGHAGCRQSFPSTPTCFPSRQRLTSDQRGGRCISHSACTLSPEQNHCSSRIEAVGCSGAQTGGTAKRGTLFTLQLINVRYIIISSIVSSYYPSSNKKNFYRQCLNNNIVGKNIQTKKMPLIYLLGLRIV